MNGHYQKQVFGLLQKGASQVALMIWNVRHMSMMQLAVAVARQQCSSSS
jgi:hypothetical protein